MSEQKPAARRGGSEEGKGRKGHRNEFARETRTVSALKTAVIYAFSIGARRLVSGGGGGGGGGGNKRAKMGERARGLIPPFPAL